MKILWNVKDGGPESHVWAWGLESKLFGSVLLLLFRSGSREAFHSHAFNAISWVLRGGLHEVFRSEAQNVYWPSLKPVFTGRETTHKVYGLTDRTWVLSFRGPWARTWAEILPSGKQLTLAHGRQVIT